MIKVTAISDLHGETPELPGGDLLIVAGDLTGRDEPDELWNFCQWMINQKYEKKIVISGNHDNTFYKNYLEEVKPFVPFTYLCDSETEFQRLKVWGSPWTSQFPNINPKCCAFTRKDESLKDRWDLIPDDVDILITHSPPLGILDQIPTQYNASVGDLDLRCELEDRIKPKLHIFGHIHEQGGKQLIFRREGHGDENNTLCINASHVNEYYKPVNKPITIEI